MIHVPITSLPGHLLFHITDCIHDSVTYAVKKAEWKTAWEQSYMSYTTSSAITLLLLNCHPPLQLSLTQPSHPCHLTITITPLAIPIPCTWWWNQMIQ